MAPLERAVDEAWWNLATSGTDGAQKEFARAGKEYNRLFSDQSEYLTLRTWYENREGLESPLLRRQVEVLYRALAERQGTMRSWAASRNWRPRPTPSTATTEALSGTGRWERTRSGSFCGSARTRTCAGRRG